MISEKYSEVIRFLNQHLARIVYLGGSGADLQFPEYDLMSFDYLEFAEQELDRKSTAARINCVAHLKRAVECELDTLLCVLGLNRQVTSFPSKLNFVRDVGIISPRSLAKLNKLRNRMEHEYADPDVDELEIYFDLANAFVHTVEGYILMLFKNELVEFGIFHDSIELITVDIETRVGLNCTVNCMPPSIQFELIEEGNKSLVVFESTTLMEYSEGLKIFFLLCREGLLSHEYILAKLNGTSLHA